MLKGLSNLCKKCNYSFPIMSLKFFNISFNAICAALLGMAMVLFADSAKGQMFSVESGTPSRIQRSSHLNVGWGLTQFDHFGDSAYVPGYDFDASAIYASYESDAFAFHGAIGGEYTGADSTRYLNFGFELNQMIPFNQSRKYRIGLPLQLSTDYTTVRNNNYVGAADQFQQSTLKGGIGIKAILQFTDGLILRSRALGKYGFSFSPGNTFIGSLAEVEWKNRFVIANIFNDRGLVIGYDLQYRRFDIDVDRYDYDLFMNRFTIGIAF